MDKKDWKEFRDSGLLWFINTILHLFGWAIVIEKLENDEIVNVYPARVDFRGFSEARNTKGYEQVTKFLQDNIDELSKEVGVDYDR